MTGTSVGQEHREGCVAAGRRALTVRGMTQATRRAVRECERGLARKKKRAGVRKITGGGKNSDVLTTVNTNMHFFFLKIMLRRETAVCAITSLKATYSVF